MFEKKEFRKKSFNITPSHKNGGIELSWNSSASHESSFFKEDYPYSNISDNESKGMYKKTIKPTVKIN